MTEETKIILEWMDERFNKVDKRFDKVDGRLDRMDGRLDRMDERLDRMDERLDKMDERLDKVDDRLDKVDERLETIERRQDRTDGKILDLRLTLENVTNRNIQIIAENHLNLDRKLNEALRVEEEKETFLIRFNNLEDEVRRIKEKMAETA